MTRDTDGAVLMVLAVVAVLLVVSGLVFRRVEARGAAQSQRLAAARRERLRSLRATGRGGR